MDKEMPVQAQCDEILKQPCMYKFPPLMFLNGHSFCPCICKAIRTAYIGGYEAAKAGKEPEVGLPQKPELPAEDVPNEGC